MGFFKNIRLGIGFIVLAGTPPFLVYDFQQMAGGRESFLSWVTLILWFFVCGALALLIVRSKGEDYARMKFLWEWPISLALLLLCLPMLLIVALLIKLESSGAAIYCQQRVGKNHRKRERRCASAGDGPPIPGERRGNGRRRHDIGGKPFTIYKLRSMITSAEKEIGAAWSTGDCDPRVTKVGYFIRKTHIDELPQLFNVLMGQMSIIGPRPERPAFVAELSAIIKDYRRRLGVAPGITGLAQVRQRHDESIEDVKKKLRYDKKYVQSGHILLDAQIIIETIILIGNLFLDSLRRRRIKKVEPKGLEVLTLGTISTDRK